tara:strand:- start:1540 stop:1809 length:270 start_codon:yes stop_codon:yes gene_type:complete
MIPISDAMKVSHAREDHPALGGIAVDGEDVRPLVVRERCVVNIHHAKQHALAVDARRSRIPRHVTTGGVIVRTKDSHRLLILVQRKFAI